MQYGLCGYAVVSLVLTIFLQPETSQPGARGVDRVLAAGGKVSWVWLNPFRSLGLLRSPNVLLVVRRSAAHPISHSHSLRPWQVLSQWWRIFVCP